MKETFIIIGEGPTEYFFLNSLKDEFRSMQNISPQYPKHTSMAELELIIKNAIEQGYNHIYCMIDLDNKKEGKDKSIGLGAFAQGVRTKGFAVKHPGFDFQAYEFTRSDAHRLRAHFQVKCNNPALFA